MMSDNGAAGIRISDASDGMKAAVARNSIHRNALGGVTVTGPLVVGPAQTVATVSEKAIG